MAKNSTEVIFDLGENPIKLVFDIYTPRPHFVLLQKNTKSSASDTELRSSFELVAEFLKRHSEFNRNAIVSFHRGSWYRTRVNHWHAHLCVPYIPYEKIAVERITVPNQGQWRGAKTISDGMKTFQEEQIRKYNGYKNELLQKYKSIGSPVKTITLSEITGNSNVFKLAWVYSKPQIAVVLRSNVSGDISLFDLYSFLTSVENNIQGKFKNFGCHFCLHTAAEQSVMVTMRAMGVFQDNQTDEEQANAVGYIQMGEEQYFLCLPENIRSIWITQFQETSHTVDT